MKELCHEKSENERLRAELRDCISRNRELESEVFHNRNMKDELEIVKEKVESKDVEYRMLENKYNEYITQQNSQISNRVHELEERLIKEQTNSRNRQEEIIHEFEHKITILNESNYSLQEKLKILSSEHN